MDLLNIDHPTYTTPRKFRGYMGDADFFAAVDVDRLAKIIRKEHTPSKHFAYTMMVLLENRAKQLQHEHGLLLDAAAVECWGRPWSVSDYKISGIGSDEFTPQYKDLLRSAAHDHSKTRRLWEIWRRVWQSIRK